MHVERILAETLDIRVYEARRWGCVMVQDTEAVETAGLDAPALQGQIDGFAERCLSGAVCAYNDYEHLCDVLLCCGTLIEHATGCGCPFPAT